MSDDTTTETPDNAAPAPEAQPETFSLEYVQQLRSEAAKYRSEKKAAAQAAEERVAAEFATKLEAASAEYADLQTKFATAELTVAKYQAMIDAGIPTDSMEQVIKLVNGHDPESIAESVASAKALMGRAVREPAIDPAQGRGNSFALNSDELEHSLKRVLGIN